MNMGSKQNRYIHMINEQFRKDFNPPLIFLHSWMSRGLKLPPRLSSLNLVGCPRDLQLASCRCLIKVDSFLSERSASQEMFHFGIYDIYIYTYWIRFLRLGGLLIFTRLSYWKPGFSGKPGFFHNHWCWKIDEHEFVHNFSLLISKLCTVHAEFFHRIRLDPSTRKGTHGNTPQKSCAKVSTHVCFRVLLKTVSRFKHLKFWSCHELSFWGQVVFLSQYIRSSWSLCSHPAAHPCCHSVASFFVLSSWWSW